jgi:hypothetical protein
MFGAFFKLVGKGTQMRRTLMIGAAFAALVVAAFSAAPADARTTCRGTSDNVNCHKATAAVKRHAMHARHRRHVTYGYTASAREAARSRHSHIARDNFPWHGWSASFHLNGARYAGGNPSGPAMFYNNYEGGFHEAAFWVIQDRVHH